VRRIAVFVMSTISGLVLLLGYHTSTGQSTTTAGGSGGSSPGSTSSGSTSSGSTSAGSGTFTGDAVDTRWGTVQVAVTVASGKITKAEAVQYPSDNPRDQEINSYALPILAQEAVSAQSASIDTVSGATVTSGGYLKSLQSAIDQAHL
jgi:uncharacterized protein with FMN-binding domain